MKENSKAQRETIEHLGQVAAAKLIGLTPRSLRDLADCPRNSDGTYPGPAMVAWFINRESDRVLLTHEAESDSPGLERYRQAKAGLAELDLLQRQGQVMPSARAREHLGLWASSLRRLGTALQRNHGVAAQQLLNEALDECDRISEQAFSGKEMVEVE